MSTNAIAFLNSENPELSIEQQLQLFNAIESGLPLVAQPYLALAEEIGVSEEQVIAMITDWQQQGLIRRFGLVIRHRKLGYVANAMVVWDVEDEQVDAIAEILAEQKVVTLCYRRPRVLPHWPYNLFCMVHGKNRDQVEAQLAQICQHSELKSLSKKLLFSNKAYKQRGGRYQHQLAT
ncbi:siroheme decarboxylase subunit beta [Thalassotalea sp. ND16A]|uniref:siroheme decarboxylase subunit beta n=1 Tax=Thalassotalea sp. ND16A TaxID=1535422 RepID=UPI00051A7FF3|nr:Lrp/AsnC family transcriptional regulator [Thalassotalea sp. ND16A]KGJ88067.1 putative transcriptional regulator, AsnC family [Thalassotalea sp. ND16A]